MYHSLEENCTEKQKQRNRSWSKGPWCLNLQPLFCFSPEFNSAVEQVVQTWLFRAPYSNVEVVPWLRPPRMRPSWVDEVTSSTCLENAPSWSTPAVCRKGWAWMGRVMLREGAALFSLVLLLVKVSEPAALTFLEWCYWFLCLAWLQWLCIASLKKRVSIVSHRRCLGHICLSINTVLAGYLIIQIMVLN